MTDRNVKAREVMKQKVVDEVKSKEQTEYDRRVTKQRLAVEIECVGREIQFKEDELKNGIVETRALNQLPGQPAIIIDGFKDNVKPSFLIENDLSRLRQNIIEITERMDQIDKSEKEEIDKEEG